MTHRKKQFYSVAVIALIVLVVILLYPIGSNLLKIVRLHTYVYGYSLPENLAVEDMAKLPPAQSVPILTYHGVIEKGEVGPNTDRKTFISQMETLKQKGYQAISVKEYDLFKNGKFVLPAKPIIITFDDGRKDSFYTVDKILEKLGFKATIFLATIKANENDSFYLNWDELAKVKATGRWEIEAHGRRSHDQIVIDEKGSLGTYLTSRIYTPGKGLESIEDYKKRVEADYINGMVDIKEHLGIDARYFAIPLNNFGDSEISNFHDDAYKFNRELTKHFFKFAFTQVYKKDGIAFQNFYNYRDSNPHEVKRLSIENMSSVDLVKSLERFAPKSFPLIFPITNIESFLRNTQLISGTFETNNGITLLSSMSTPAARMLFGDQGWKNYTIKTTIAREKGRSVSIIAYYKDEDNLISLSWGERSIRLVERADGKERELASYYPWEKEGAVEIAIYLYNNSVSVYFSGVTVAYEIPIKLSRGAAGFGVWDPNGAQSTIRKLEITSLNK